MLVTKGYMCKMCGRSYADLYSAEECARDCFNPAGHISSADMWLCGRCGRIFAHIDSAKEHEKQCAAAISRTLGECVSCALCDVDGWRHEGCPSASGSGNRADCPFWRQATK